MKETTNMTQKQKEIVSTSNELLTREPFPASTKEYIKGKVHKDIRVPVREILLANETKLRVIMIYNKIISKQYYILHDKEFKDFNLYICKILI